MKIAVDLDDTLGDFAKEFLKFCNKKLKTNYSIKDIDSYYSDGLFGLSREEFNDLAREFLGKGHDEEIEPLEDAMDAISDLKENHELVIMTSRKKTEREKTILWIEKHFPNVFEEIYHARYTSEDESLLSKAKFCKKLGAKVLIDDALHHHEDCHTNGVRSILIDKPWNQSEDLHENIVRVNSWKEIAEEIKKLE